MDCQAGVARLQLRRGDSRLSPIPARTRQNPSGVYFNWLLISENFSAMLMPSALTSPMMASAIAAAIKQYSMAVAPDSSAKNLLKVRFSIRIPSLLEVVVRSHAFQRSKVE
jgi:hypothetical protein